MELAALIVVVIALIGFMMITLRRGDGPQGSIAESVKSEFQALRRPAWWLQYPNTSLPGSNISYLIEWRRRSYWACEFNAADRNARSQF